MASEKVTIQKLKGASNYEVWALRTESYLIKEGLKEAIQNSPPLVSQSDNDKTLANIRLLLEDGPLLQIQNLNKAKEAWESLKNLYSPKGFSSEFLLCRDFFETTLTKYSSMEEYLNKVKQLSDQLMAKKLALPKQVVIAWVLNSLTDNYDGFISNITQSLRSNSEAYSLETLFSYLLDESKRLESKDSSVFYTQHVKYKGKKPYKITKGKYCKYCKLTSHEAKQCFFLFPDKAPKGWNRNMEKPPSSPPQKHPRDVREENIDILYSNISTQTTKEAPTSKEPSSSLSSSSSLELDLDMDEINFDDIEVFITQDDINTLITNEETDLLKATISGLAKQASLPI